jgi:apolipoprotein D and lipocalin family protein
MTITSNSLPYRRLSAIFLSVLLGACAGNQPPLATVDHVELERFMGDWYVIGGITTFLEKGAHNAVESYELKPDGSIATTFVFRKDGFDGEEKVHHPVGFVTDTDTNAVWGMRFVWPIKADYRIVYLTEDYSQTIIGRNKRDYVWIMARTPTISDDDYQQMLDLIESMGYDMSKVKKVPQKW